MDGIVVAQAVAPEVPDQAERLGVLFDVHYARLYRLARRLSRSQDDALDLVQDTFLRAAGALARSPAGASAEEAWLVRVLVNLQRDAWRRSRVRVDHDARARRSTVSTHPESALVASTTLWCALDALPPRRRAVVVMHALEGLPVRTVASLLGVTAVTVRWHLFRARGDLNVATTADGGVTWTLVRARGLSGFRSVVAWLPGSSGGWMAVGPAGSDISDDDGRTWTPAGGAGYDALSLVSGADSGWATGAGGRIARGTPPPPAAIDRGASR